MHWRRRAQGRRGGGYFGSSTSQRQLPLRVTVPRCAEPIWATYFSGTPASGVARADYRPARRRSSATGADFRE
jgi:hypothetical protein